MIGRSQILLLQIAIISMLLSAISLPEVIQSAAPFWFFLFFSYWLIYTKNNTVYTYALLLGLLLDLLQFNVLGQNALALVISTFFILSVKKSFYFSNTTTQQVYIFLGSVIYLLVIIGTHWIIQGFDFSYLLFFAPITSSIMWPIILFFLPKLNFK